MVSLVNMSRETSKFCNRCMWEVAMHERSKKGGGGIAEIACIAGAGEGKNFEDASAHEGKKLHN